MTQPHTLLPASRTAVTWAICICIHLLCATVAAARDSSYIARSESRMAFKLFANNDFLSVIREYRDKEYTYKCNRPICLGIGASYRNSGMNFSYGIDALSPKGRGRTESFDKQYSYYGKDFLIDVIAQSYEGFYLDSRREDGSFPVFEDMCVMRAGVSGMYVLNSERFSLRAAFGNREKQLRPAGSLLVGGGASYIMIRNMVRPDGSPQTARPMHGVMFGPSVGYSYCWVFLKDLYVNLGATLGIDFSAGDIDWGIFPSAMPRIGIGYDNSQWAVFMNYKNHIVFPSISADDRIGISSGTITLGCAYRIL